MNGATSRFVGLIASLGIASFAIGTPIALAALGVMPSTSTFGWRSLTRPDDGTLALALITVVAWAAWLLLTALLSLEVVARLRGVETARVSGFTVPQRVAAKAVAAASLLFLAVPVASSAMPVQQSANTAERPSEEAGQTSSPSAETDQPLHPEHAEPVAQVHARTMPYVVRRGDSLWKIAEQRLGDGRRYVELVELNALALKGRPDFIAPGLVLQVPLAETVQPETYAVQRGDTLSKIADEKLGNAARYPEIAEASRDTIQHDGRHLRDPDLLRPGWQLTIPAADGPRISPSPAKTPDPDDSALAESADDDQPANAESDFTARWVLPGLTGAGALLAGCALLVLSRNQRTQRRFRTPGHRIERPPTELLDVERTVRFAGSGTAPNIERLDALLRTLSAHGSGVPSLAWAALDAHQVALHLDSPTALAAPWQGRDRSWTAPLDANVDRLPDARPPYPLLVSVGRNPSGHLFLVNLEHLKIASVVGPADRVDAFARYVAAELALSPWSLLTEVTTIGVAEELATIDPLRLHHQHEEGTMFHAQFAADIDPDGRLPGFDPDRYRVLVTTNANRSADFGRLVETVATHPGRPGAAVLTLNQVVRGDEARFVLDDQGNLRIDALDLSLLAAGLTSDEAEACASILNITREANDVAMPVVEWNSNTQLESLLDASGAIRAEFTAPRPAGAAGIDSLLPQSNSTYIDSGATTLNDLETLAPLVPEGTRDQIEGADAILDGDLRDWFSESPVLPHLTLLGPVNARTRGEASAVVRRKPYYVELLAFLATHPSGVTLDEASLATGVSASRTRADLAALRAWLGRNPRTDQPHLPDARSSRAAADRGIPCYQVEDVLTDLDLFRRLRARGQARGADGIHDLVTALRLVSGEPFSHLRPAGWTWLAEGERLDHIMSCAIVDVAHLVTTRALEQGDLDLARLAAETAYGAVPDDDVSRLDLVQVAAASGHAELAERHLLDGILNRSDDGRGPMDIPTRSRQVVDRKQWASPTHRTSST